MDIKWKELELYRFMSFDSATFHLEDNGFVQVSGINTNKSDNAKSNGSGKSSWTDALCWAITGKTIRGTKDVVNIKSDNGCYVRVLFDVNGKEYEIIRSKNHSEYKTNLKIYINGEDKSGKGIKDSEELLSQYLPELTYKLINSVIVLGQGLPERFTNNSPSGRKEILEQLTNSDFMIEDVKEKVSRRKDALLSEKQKLHDSNVEISSRITSANNNLSEYRNQLENIPDAKSVREKISELAKLIERLKKEKAQHLTEQDVVEGEINALRSKLSSLVSEQESEAESIRNKYSAELSELSEESTRLKVEISSLNSEILRIKAIVDVCPTCGQKIHNAEKPDTSDMEMRLNALKTSYNDINDKLSSVTAKMNEMLSEAKNRRLKSMQELEESIESKEYYRKHVSSNVTNAMSSIGAAQADAISLNSELATIDATKKSISDIIDKLTAQLKSDEERILYITDKEKDVDIKLSAVNKISSVINRDFRGYLLSDIISYVNTKCKEYCKYVFENDKIDFMLNGNNLDISYDGKEYECLSGGEKQKINIIVQFAIRAMLCGYVGFSSNVLVLDEVFDNLDFDGCQNIVNLISNVMTDVDSVYIITHHLGLQIPYDNEIVIVKNNEGMSSLQ